MPRTDPASAPTPRPQQRAARATRPNVDQLTDLVRARIIRGELGPGQRLTEEWLASEFGVSRIPVREALRVLASEGFVESNGYHGTFVAGLDAEEAHDLLDVRAALEPLAAAQAALRRTPEHLETFRRIVDEAGAALREARYDDVRALNAAFHEHIAVTSGNGTIIALMRVVRFKMEWATSIDAIKRGAGDPAALHLDIVDAITDRDPARAATAAAVHIDASYNSRRWQRAVDVRYGSLVP